MELSGTMLNAAMKARQPKKNRRRWCTRHPGIVGDARTLGVTYTHLYRVLVGERQSPGLSARYSELQALRRAQRRAE